MNWERIEGQWQQLKGHAKSRWAKLTDDDVENIAGKKDVLIGKIQGRYGVLKDEAEKQIDVWLARLSRPADKTETSDAKDKQT